jgi:hypothetical protein
MNVSVAATATIGHVDRIEASAVIRGDRPMRHLAPLSPTQAHQRPGFLPHRLDPTLAAMALDTDPVPFLSLIAIDPLHQFARAHSVGLGEQGVGYVFAQFTGVDGGETNQ